MDAGPLSKVSAKTAAEVCSRYKLTDAARKRLQDGLTPRQFVELLLQAHGYEDAFDFLAYALPRREAIWWACLTLRHILGPDLPPLEQAALKAVVEWVLQPDEAKRRAAQAAGEAIDFKKPVGFAAMAVYGSSGSLGPPTFPEVTPPKYMTAQAVSASITLVSAKGESATLLARKRELVELGMTIADGQNLWPAKAKTTTEPLPTRAIPRPRA